MSRLINSKQVKEWAENPVTELFQRILQEERDETEAMTGLQAFTPFDPQRTQEVLANLNGFVDAMDIVIESLGGDWSNWEEEGDEH